jgi:hypothetical protein
MTAKQFVTELTGKDFEWTRIDLAEHRIDEQLQVNMHDPAYTKGGASIRAGHSGILCYDDTDCLFTCDCNVYVATVLTGAGHIFCDRFKPGVRAMK